MSHPVLGDLNFLGGQARQCSKTVVRIADTDAGKKACKQDTQFQKKPAASWQSLGASQEARAQDDLGATAKNRLHEGREIAGVVLAVAVKCDYGPCPSAQSEVDAGLQSCPLAAIRNVSQDPHRKVQSHLKRTIARAIIHHDDSREPR